MVRFIGKWFWLAQPIKSHSQLNVISLFLCLHQHTIVDGCDEITIVVVRWDDNYDYEVCCGGDK